jgi:flagellar motor switch protein FliN/FliY
LADLPDFSSDHRNPEVDRILGLTVPCSVILAQRDMSIQSILGITGGTIIEFNVPFDADLTLYIANRPIARGKAIKVGENFGLRIDKIDTIEHRIDALAGH